jgi:hypothetical protein
LGKILNIIWFRRVKQEMAKRGIEPVDMTGVMLKIILIAMFFSVDISYVVAELKRRKELRCFAQVGEIHEAQKIYRFIVGFVSGVLNLICVKTNIIFICRWDKGKNELGKYC